MFLLFEGLKYSREELEIIKLDARFYDDSCVVHKCGYFRPSESDAPIFCLPKVFIKGKNLFIGEYVINGIIDTKDEAFVDDQNIKDIIFNLSTWLYAAIRTYQKRMAQRTIDTKIIHNSGSQNIVSNIGEDDYTQLDVIMALYDFYKQNNSLFIKIAREAHSRLSKINWAKTVQNNLPIFQDEIPIYTQLQGTRNEINYDEELITLFFSTLSYIAETYGVFVFRKPIGYSLKPTHFIEDGLDTGSIERYLLRIKRNYFSDKMRYLWQILYMFYTHEENANTEQEASKYLLVHSFQNVFEDMVEFLIGDEKLPEKKLKDQKDGHQIDHIFKYDSLIYNQESIYYVGDSKYYKETSDIQEYSEEKQYTYAHNVIKYNMDFFRNPQKGNYKDFIDGTRYRDNITEGYSITPNFFISGIIKDPTDYYSNDFDLRRDKNGNPEPPKQASYFDDRLFDRDTLFLQHYDINFLFVLSSYVNGNNSERNTFRLELQEKLRNNFIEFFNLQYKFFLIEEYGDIEIFVEKYFRILVGKIFYTSDKRLILALERHPRKRIEQEQIVLKLENNCKLIPYTLN